MRQISIDAANAFMQNKEFTRNNTKVRINLAQEVELILFGNVIAAKPLASNQFVITTAGWATRTTFDRLNALPGVSLCTRLGQTFLNDLPWDGEWINPKEQLLNLFGVNAA